MKFSILAGCAALAFAAATPAQNLVITNGRIIDGTGNVIDRGSVVVQGGKIVSVSSGGAPGGSAGPRIDAHGMTVMAGFIAAPRHFIRGDAAAWLKDKAADNMKSFVNAGFTTVFSMGDNPQGILELRSRLKSGAIMGPTLLAAAIVWMCLTAVDDLELSRRILAVPLRWIHEIAGFEAKPLFALCGGVLRLQVVSETGDASRAVA